MRKACPFRALCTTSTDSQTYRNVSQKPMAMPEGGGGGGEHHVNTDFADLALLLPLNMYGEKRRPFCWANKTCRALL